MLFCALAASVAAWCVFAIVVELGSPPVFGLAAALVFAAGRLVWAHATRVEVHDLALCFLALTLLCAVRWYRRGDPRALVLGAAAWGLGIATHPIDALIAPGVLVLGFRRIRSLSPARFAAAAGAMLLGLSLYAYLPIRSAMVDRFHLDPVTRLGLPAGGSFWNTDNPSTLHGFATLVTGKQFDAGAALSAIFSPGFYDGSGFGNRLYWELTPAVLLLALAGIVALWRHRRTAAIGLILAALVPTLFSFTYTVEADLTRYQLPAFFVAGVFAGCGPGWLLRTFPRWRAALLLIFAAVAATELVLNDGLFRQWHDDRAATAATSLLARTPQRAVIVAPWLWAAPLAYEAYVEHRGGERIVVAAWLRDVARKVPAWTNTRPVFIAGQIFGHPPRGYRLERLRGTPPLWRVSRRSR